MKEISQKSKRKKKQQHRSSAFTVEECVHQLIDWFSSSSFASDSSSDTDQEDQEHKSSSPLSSERSTSWKISNHALWCFVLGGSIILLLTHLSLTWTWGFLMGLATANFVLRSSGERTLAIRDLDENSS